MKKQPELLLAVCLTLGIAYDYLFWEERGGINFGIFLGLSVFGGLYLLIKAGHRPAPRALWLLLPFAFSISVYAIRREPLTLFLAVAFALLSLGTFASTYLSGKWIEYQFIEYIERFISLLLATLFNGAVFASNVKKELKESEVPRARFPIWGILRGVLITIPILIFFTTLFSYADAVFSQRVNTLFEDFSTSEVIGRTIAIALVAYGLAGVILFAAEKSSSEGVNRAFVIKPIFGTVETTIILASVTLLFLSFVGIQFQYFFGGVENIGVEGYTYSSYARRGFNELIAAGFSSMLLILILGGITRRDTERQRRLFSGFSIAIVVQVIVILVSAFQRLNLAMDWHGYSRLRLYPRIFLVWVGILFLAVVILEVFQRERFFLFSAYLASLGFFVTLALFNIDASIVTHNVQRVREGRHLDSSQLASLSPDAVPALVREYRSAQIPPETRQLLAAALLCYRNSDKIQETEEESWQSFNVSVWRARQALDMVSQNLDYYKVNLDRRTPRIRLPISGEVFDCPDEEDGWD